MKNEETTVSSFLPAQDKYTQALAKLINHTEQRMVVKPTVFVFDVLQPKARDRRMVSQYATLHDTQLRLQAGVCFS